VSECLSRVSVSRVSVSRVSVSRVSVSHVSVSRVSVSRVSVSRVSVSRVSVSRVSVSRVSVSRVSVSRVLVSRVSVSRVSAGKQMSAGTGRGRHGQREASRRQGRQFTRNEQVRSAGSLQAVQPIHFAGSATHSLSVGKQAPATGCHKKRAGAMAPRGAAPAAWIMASSSRPPARQSALRALLPGAISSVPNLEISTR